MKNKGFTLVELLAVVVLLGLVIILVITNGFGIFNKAKGGINKIEEDNLIEAAKVFLVDVDNKFVKESELPNGCTYTSFSSVCRVDVSYIINNYMDKVPESCLGSNKYLNLKIEYIYESDGSLKETNYIVNPVDADGNQIVVCSN